MSVEVYSKCRIQSNETNGRKQYFDQCLVELRQFDFGEYVLRAIDLNNRKTEVFNCPLVRRDQYIFAPTANQPDTFSGTNGIYQLLLDDNSHAQFHQILRTCLEEFLIIKDNVYSEPVNSIKQEKSKEFISELCVQADESYYRNDEPFECITCMETIPKGEGILFRHCLHPFCKPCLLHMIETSTDPIIKCQHENCSTILEERELRGVAKDLKVDQKIIDRLLDISVRFVEGRNQTIHCLTPDCPNWWFIEPKQAHDMIPCDGCKHWNCLACKAIHEGQTCREYQDGKLKEANDSTARKDAEHLEELVKTKQAMYCPGCRILIQKISGCDWIQCSQCKIEICWPTQGPRWGPKGHGDTSGGCRCRVDGKLCVPNCQNCH